VTPAKNQGQAVSNPGPESQTRLMSQVLHIGSFSQSHNKV